MPWPPPLAFFLCPPRPPPFQTITPRSPPFPCRSEFLELSLEVEREAQLDAQGYAAPGYRSPPPAGQVWEEQQPGAVWQEAEVWDVPPEGGAAAAAPPAAEWPQQQGQQQGQAPPGADPQQQRWGYGGGGSAGGGYGTGPPPSQDYPPGY